MTYRINPHEVGNDSLCVIYDHQLREMRETPDEGYPLGISASEVRVPLGFAAVDEVTWSASREAIKQRLIDAFHQVDESTHDLDVDLAAHEASEALYGYVMAHWPIPEWLCSMEDAYLERIESEDDRLLKVEVRSAMATHMIDASTTDEQLQQLANLLAQEAREDNILLLDAEELLSELRDEVRRDDPQWGPLTPYLEALLEQGSPVVRRKNPGPYNPEGKRTILIATGATRGNEGNWTPAILNESDEAVRQWEQAGLDYPFKREASHRRRVEMMRQLPEREKTHCERRHLPPVAEQRQVVRDIRKQMSRLEEETARLLESNNMALDANLTSIAGMMASRHITEEDRKRLADHATLKIHEAIGVAKEALGDASWKGFQPVGNEISRSLASLADFPASERLADCRRRMIAIIEDYQVRVRLAST